LLLIKVQLTRTSNGKFTVGSFSFLKILANYKFPLM
jgi:hypothetical protein